MIMVGAVVRWLVSPWIGWIVSGAIVGLVALSINNAVQRSKGAAAVVTGSIEKAKAANERNAKIREKAKEPGAAERLLRDHCRDC